MRTDEPVTEDVQEPGMAEELPPSLHISVLVWIEFVVPALKQIDTLIIL